MSCAKIGSSAVADEKNVAKKSSNMVERIMGDEKTNRSPSPAAWRLIFPLSLSNGLATPRMRSSATITTTNENALTTYTHFTPAVATTTPASEGPATEAI